MYRDISTREGGSILGRLVGLERWRGRGWETDPNRTKTLSSLTCLLQRFGRQQRVLRRNRVNQQPGVKCINIKLKLDEGTMLFESIKNISYLCKIQLLWGHAFFGWIARTKTTSGKAHGLVKSEKLILAGSVKVRKVYTTDRNLTRWIETDARMSNFFGILRNENSLPKRIRNVKRLNLFIRRMEKPVVNS